MRIGGAVLAGYLIATIVAGVILAGQLDRVVDEDGDLLPTGVDITLDAEGYGLDLGDETVDVLRFADLCARERSLPPSSLVDRVALLERAVALFGGDPSYKFAHLAEE